VGVIQVDSHTSYSGYDELRSQVESTYGEMVPFSNTDYENHLNQHIPALETCRRVIVSDGPLRLVAL
jgi:hypothetical protein